MPDPVKPHFARPAFSWLAWAQLVRLPTVFTILADVGAAFLLSSHGPFPISRLVCILMAGVALYWAGMILNDVFDIDQDRKQRSNRPLPAGNISVQLASRVGWVLLAVGVATAWISGFLPGNRPGEALPLASTWLPGAIATVLAIMIVAYDGPLKKTPLAAYAMGSCRFLSFLLGASPVLVADGGQLIPTFLIAIALGFGIYIAGITTIARNEAVGGYSRQLHTGMLLVIIGTVVLAFASQTAAESSDWRFSPRGMFPLLIGLIAFPVIMRGLRLFRSPSARNIQNMIRVGILSIIPFSASFAFLGAGRVWGLAVFALVVPAILVSIKMRVT